MKKIKFGMLFNRSKNLLTLTSLNKLNQRGFLFKKKEKKETHEDEKAQDVIDRFSSKTVDRKQVMIAADYFQIERKDKRAFLTIVEDFRQRTSKKDRLGQAEFVYGALKKLKEYDLHKDIEVYKALMNVFPKEIMKPKNFIQYSGFHFPKQQTCALFLLNEMEYNRIWPDKEMETLVISIFSKYSYVWKKLARQLYWSSKLVNASPFLLPRVLPKDPKKLAKIAIRQMSADRRTKISVFFSDVIKESIDKTWIISAQSPIQQQMIKELNEPIYIQGPHRIWLRDLSISYFVLSTLSSDVKESEFDDFNDVSNLSLSIHGGQSKESLTEKEKKIHTQKDGTILGICATGTSSRDSLLSWIRILEHHVPKLKHLKIIFTLKSPSSDLISLNNVNSIFKEREKS